MNLGLKISGVELACLSGWWRGYSLNYTLWRTGVIKSKCRRSISLIFAPQVYPKFQRRRTPEEQLAYLGCEFYTECALASMQNEQWVYKNTEESRKKSSLPSAAIPLRKTFLTNNIKRSFPCYHSIFPC